MNPSTDPNRAAPAPKPAPTERGGVSLPQAAKGDDDLMSTPGTTSADDQDRALKWQKQIASAQSFWRRLTRAELAQVHGVEAKLAQLLQDRYAMAQDLAARAARNFLAKPVA